MGNDLLAIVAFLPFVTLIFTYLFYTDQTKKSIKETLGANEEKRYKVILELHKNAQALLQEIVKSINSEVLDKSDGHKEIKSNRIRDFRDKSLEVFYLLDDAKDIKESYRLTSKALSNARNYGLILFIAVAIAVYSIVLTSGSLMLDLIAYWIFILTFLIPFIGIKLGKSLKIYKVIGHLLSKHEVGIHDEYK